MQIREARPEDAEAIRTVHYDSITELGPAAYDSEQVDAWARGVESADYAAVDSEDYYVVVAEVGGDVRGFGSLRLEVPDSDEASAEGEVTGVYVHPSVARQGVGSAILAALERQARAHGIRSLGLSASLNAVPFYESHGYERVRECVHEFSSHESTGVEGRVVEMRKEL